jgi:hypothetical protein
MSECASDSFHEVAHKPTAVGPRHCHSNSNSQDVVASHSHRRQTASLSTPSTCKKKKSVRVRRHDSIVGQTCKQVKDAVTNWNSVMTSASHQTRSALDDSDRSTDQATAVRRAVSIDDVDRREVSRSSVVAVVGRSSEDTLRRAHGLHRSSSSPDLSREGRGSRVIRSGHEGKASRRRVDHDIYQSYLAGVLQSSHQSDKFIHLRRLYATVERASAVEAELQLLHATAGDSSARDSMIRTDSFSGDLSKRRRVRALNEELENLYARLDAACNSKEFFYLGYGDRLSKFRWNGANDPGLATRQLQVDDLRAMYSASLRRDRFGNKVCYDWTTINDSGIRQMPFRRLLSLFRRLDDKARNEEITRRLQQNQRQMRSQTSISSCSSSCRLDGTYLRIMEEVAARSKERPMYGYHMYEYQHPYDKYVQSRRLSVPQSTTNVFELPNDDEPVTDEMRLVEDQQVSDVFRSETNVTDKRRPTKLTDKPVQNIHSVDRKSNASKSCGISPADRHLDTDVSETSLVSEHCIMPSNGFIIDCSPLIEEEKVFCQMAIDRSASSDDGRQLERLRNPNQHTEVCQKPYDVTDNADTEPFLRRRSSYVTAINNVSNCVSTAGNIVENARSCIDRPTSPHSFRDKSTETSDKSDERSNAVNRNEHRPRLNIRAFRRQKEQWRRNSKPLPGTVSNVLTYLSSVNFDASCLNGHKTGLKIDRSVAPDSSEVPTPDENWWTSAATTDGGALCRPDVVAVPSQADPSNDGNTKKCESNVEARSGRARKRSSTSRRHDPRDADNDAAQLSGRTQRHTSSADPRCHDRSSAETSSPSVDVKRDVSSRPECNYIECGNTRKLSVKTNIARRPSERKGSASDHAAAPECSKVELGVAIPPSDGADKRHSLQAVRPTYVSSVTYIARPMSVVSTRIEPKFVKSHCAAVRKLDRVSTVASAAADRKSGAKTRRNGGISRSDKHKQDDIGIHGEQGMADTDTIYLTLPSEEHSRRLRQGCDHERNVSSSSPSGSSTLCKSRNREKSTNHRHSMDSIQENVNTTRPTDDIRSAADVNSSASSLTKPRCHRSNDERNLIANKTYFETSFGIDNDVEVHSNTSVLSASSRQPCHSSTRSVARSRREPTSVSATSGLSSDRCFSAAAHEHMATSVDRRSLQVGKAVEATAPPGEEGGNRRGCHRVRRQDSLLMSAMMNSLETIGGEWARDSDKQNMTSQDSIASSGTATELTGATVTSSFAISARLKARQYIGLL